MSQPATVHSLSDLRAVRAMMADAEPVAQVRPERFKKGEPRGGVEAGKWSPGILGLPEDCPVQPIGVSGPRLWLLDAIGQVRSYDPPYGKGEMLNLFGGEMGWLEWAWPRWGKDGVVAGFANEEVLASLMKACIAKGPWNPIDKMRGRGCWTDGGGNLVIHTGKRIIAGGRAEPCGEVDGYVYPTREKLPGPFLREDAPFNPARMLRSTLRTWNWVRPEVDPHLLLGWIGAGFLGGALPWRPMAFLTGDKGTGKSTLQALLKNLFGDWLVQSTDTTAAGIYQHIGLDSVPVAVDELEAEADNKKVVAVLKLARQASSGGVMLRGGDRHNPVEFKARSAFIFSSINAPPLKPQDLSRMALLRLDKLVAGQAVPALDPQAFQMIGQCVLTRLMTEWGRFHETFNAFAEELGHAGMDGRGQAQFGTLLTCADMIEFEGWNAERLAFPVEADGELVPWRRLLEARHMVEFEDQTANWLGCLSHLLAVRVEAWRAGARNTVGQVLQCYYENMTHPGEHEGADIVSANRDLAQAGLRIVFRDWDGPDGREKNRPWLAVHNQSPLVRQLFEGSDWAGSLGAGVWSAALRQGPRGRLWEPQQVRVNGVQLKATLVSLDGLYGEGGVMAEEE